MRDIHRRIGRAISHATVHAVLRCTKTPRWGQLELVVEALGGDVEEFLKLWISVRDAEDSAARNKEDREQRPSPATARRANNGRPSAGVDDPTVSFVPASVSDADLMAMTLLEKVLDLAESADQDGRTYIAYRARKLATMLEFLASEAGAEQRRRLNRVSENPVMIEPERAKRLRVEIEKALGIDNLA